MKHKKTLIVLVAILLLIVACQKVGFKESESERLDRKAEVTMITGGFRPVYRFVDREYGFVCYSFFDGGIDCNRLEER